MCRMINFHRATKEDSMVKLGHEVLDSTLCTENINEQGPRLGTMPSLWRDNWLVRVLDSAYLVMRPAPSGLGAEDSYSQGRDDNPEKTVWARI